MDEIALLLKEMRFRKKIIGGVDEADVWKQLETLQKEYRIVYEAQEAMYKALLAEKDAELLKMKKFIKASRTAKGERHE